MLASTIQFSNNNHRGHHTHNGVLPQNSTAYRQPHVRVSTTTLCTKPRSHHELSAERRTLPAKRSPCHRAP
ncbi:hypothetical protein DFQ14_1342 [Halopolyspora algeriensis]|uniref:Uncharacterized protein n=1 Tax=Halopolyspora algeriensis TaxID=1500506 RepID=A0A368VAH5_9ACTN|nr:hypothetical protein DFQ14_1342 [Halopolyspora algeriensis]